MARRAPNIEDSDSPAWKILQSRLAIGAIADDLPAEIAAAETGDAPEWNFTPAKDDAPEQDFAPDPFLPPTSDSDVLLFAAASAPHQKPSTFAWSFVVHTLVAVIVCFSLGYKPPSSRVITERYSIRQLDLSELAEEAAARIRNPIKPPDAAHPNKAQQAPQSHPLPLPNPGLQTLVQPDLPNTIKLAQQIPVPKLVLWSASKTVVKRIVPPLQKNLTAPNVPAVLERPNQELRVTDVAISSNNQLSLKSQAVPGNTSPVVNRNSVQVQQPLSSVSQLSATPAPAAVLSLSDLHMQSGTAELPPVSESPKADSQGGLAPGQGRNSSIQNGEGDSGEGTASELGELTTTPIVMSKEGHFSSVVVGNNIGQQYPEIADAWRGRVVYTAYLHVGLSKNWILQYSRPRDAAAAASGSVSRLEAPWPYNLVRPNLPPGAIDADALMIHGFVNASGHFENLSVVFPQPFAIAQFVLDALQKWQFRPATEDGRAARVEVMLIIPETFE